MGKRDLHEIFHARCGGPIRIVTTNEIGCKTCSFHYVCETLEQPMEAVYRLIDDGTLVQVYDDEEF